MAIHAATDYNHTHTHAHTFSEQMLNITANGKSMGRNNVSKKQSIVPSNALVCICTHSFTPSPLAHAHTQTGRH